MTNVTRIGVKSVANVLADALENAAQSENVVIVTTNKNGEVSVGWSNQSQADLAYNLIRLTKVLHQEII